MMFSVAATLICAQQTLLVAGDIFLAKGGSMLSKEEVNGILFEEIKGFFGQDSAAGRLETVEKFLSPMFASLPKDSHGGLGPVTVRYALHRFFAQYHAWHLKGLEPTGAAWNESTPTGILADNVPSYIQALFEDHLGEAGFGLHELAVLAVALEHIVKTETVKRIEMAYEGMSLQASSVFEKENVAPLLDAHQAVYLLGIKNVSLLRKALPKMNRIYPGWEDTQMFLRDTQANLAHAERHVTNPFVPPKVGFREVSHIIEQVNDQFGRFQDIECRQTRDFLLEKEYKGSGRMRLADFYGLALNGDKRFSESTDYLRQVGALDESQPSDPLVIIANYMYGKNNCFSSSAFYSVCCLDECEPLLGHLERVFAEPEVEADRLADAVALLPSTTVVAPRNLSSGLLLRLKEIAERHGGRVPLHGRLFAQWMHHAFPRECPHPHVSGTTNQINPKEYELRSGKKIIATHAELKHQASLVDVRGSTDAADQTSTEMLPWEDEEELLVSQSRQGRPNASRGCSWLTAAFMLVAVGAVMHGLVQKFQVAQGALRERQSYESKQYV